MERRTIRGEVALQLAAGQLAASPRHLSVSIFQRFEIMFLAPSSGAFD
jgi:hypothetical protein